MAKVDMSMVPKEYISESGRYKPGNDAKHVSALVAEAKADNYKVATTRELSKQLPTPALKEKFAKAVERAKAPKVVKERAPRAAKADKPVAEPVEGDIDEDTQPVDPELPREALGYTEGVIKRGRWEYPSRTFTDGSVEVNTKADGSGEWVDAN